MLGLCHRQTLSLRTSSYRQFVSCSVLHDASSFQGPGKARDLGRMRELLHRVNLTNKPSEKVDIVLEYPDLSKLLAMTHDTHLRYNLTSKSVRKQLDANQDVWPSRFTTVRQLLSALNVKDANVVDVVDFMRNHQITTRVPAAGEDGLSECEVFFRLLDKNLKVGLGQKLTNGIVWPKDDASGRSAQDNLDVKQLSCEEVSKKSDQSVIATTTSVRERYNVDKELPLAAYFEPALGKTILQEDLSKLFNDNKPGAWYASRKLDGVRCLVVTDVAIELDELATVKAVQVLETRCYSRQGNPFYTLDRINEEIKRCVDGWDGIDALLGTEHPRSLEIGQGTDGKGRVERCVKRFVLDGELCILKESDAEGGIMIEDFKSCVGLVKRKSGTIDHISMFLLDFIPGTVFESAGATQSGNKTFAERQKDCDLFLRRVEDMSASGSKQHAVLRRLDQQKVSTVAQVEDMIAISSEQGWEGLIIRRDLPYAGKRSVNIKKYKAWMDAEYTVMSVDTNIMRLPIAGEYADRLALANIWVEHKGVPVSIGSGFTSQQRLHYAAHPEDIIGKQVTVEYFGESTSDSRDRNGGGLSLRFPRLKMIWEGDGRDI